MKIAIKQVRGGSGVDIWAENLCHEISHQGHSCTINLQSGLYQFVSILAKLQKNENKLDIIQSNTWNGFAFKNTASLVATEHLVVHDPEYHKYRTLPQKLYHSWIYRCEEETLRVADAVVCVSKSTGKPLRKFSAFLILR